MTAGPLTWRRRLGVALAAALAVASFVGLRAAAGESATATAGAAAARSSHVKIVGLTYKPARLTVRRGTRVTFANRGPLRHTATQNGGGFDTGVIRPGRSASVAFKRRGVYRFHCTLHPSMRGKIIVR